MSTQEVKDILNTEVPKPSFVLSPSVSAPLPSGVTHTRNGQDNVARTLDPYSGKFEHVEEDTPRVYSSDQGLLVEAAGRTNQVLDSSKIDKGSSNWSGVSASTTIDTSIIDGEDAYKITPNSNTSDRVEQEVGSFSGGKETCYLIFESGESNVVRLSVFDDTGSAVVAKIEYDLGSRSISASTGNANARVLTELGPSNGTIFWIQVQYDSSGLEGNTRKIRIFPDNSGGNNAIIAHHAQIEEALNASSPIVTQGSPVTRAGDDYAIFEGGQPEWWNPNEGTIYLEIIPAAHQYNFNNVISFTSSQRIEVDKNNEVQYTDFSTSPATAVDIKGLNFPFSSTKIALSIIDGVEVRLSVNGNIKSKLFSGNPLNNTVNLNMGSSGILAQYLNAKYYPRALPESTLNTLTT